MQKANHRKKKNPHCMYIVYLLLPYAACWLYVEYIAHYYVEKKESFVRESSQKLQPYTHELSQP
jgi:hypothetical protein